MRPGIDDGLELAMFLESVTAYDADLEVELDVYYAYDADLEVELDLYYAYEAELEVELEITTPYVLAELDDADAVTTPVVLADADDLEDEWFGSFDEKTAVYEAFDDQPTSPFRRFGAWLLGRAA